MKLHGLKARDIQSFTPPAAGFIKSFPLHLRAESRSFRGDLIKISLTIPGSENSTDPISTTRHALSP